MRRILVIEDDSFIKNNLELLLKKSGYGVITADCGNKGLQLAKEMNPELILADIMLPDINGFELLGGLSRDPETQCIPLIFLTSISDQKVVRRGMNAGADDYITKPFKAQDLLDTIKRRLLKKENLERKLRMLLPDSQEDVPQ